jgi:hypothetical protein
MKHPGQKARRFQVMLHQPRNISVVFQYKYGLAQPVCPSLGGLLNFSCKGRTEPLTD